MNVNSLYPADLTMAKSSKFSVVHKFGLNSDIDTGSVPEDIWDGGGLWVPPTTARVHNIASSDAADTSAGTGARTVKIYGLDEDWAELSETVTLNGTTPVATTGSYIIIDRMRVMTTGTGKENAGAISATAVTDATISASISAGNNTTLMSILAIPANMDGYLLNYSAGILSPGNPASDSIEVRLMINETEDLNGHFRVADILPCTAYGTSVFVQEYNPALYLPPKSIIKLQVSTSTANNLRVKGDFSIVKTVQGVLA